MPLIGFRRNIYFEWLEETAALVCLGEDPADIRRKLDELIRAQIASAPNRRMAIDILIEIWDRSADGFPVLHREAVELFQRSDATADHVLLHYGMTMASYPFFRQACAIIGQTLRFGDSIRTATLQKSLPATIGGMGALHDACKRVTFSLRNWGILADGTRRYEYVQNDPPITPSSASLACWLLAAALSAHPAETMPLPDLQSLPELFPFHIAVTRQDIKASPLLDVFRSGGGWDTVRIAMPAPD